MSYLVSKSQYIRKVLPEFLFYKRNVHNLMFSKQLEFVAFSTKNSKNYGEILVRKSTVQHREDYAGPILAIDLIKSKNINQGLGTAMINFAKNYSKQNGCNGYLILRADASLSPDRVPQIFYRKQGFSTFDDKTDTKMDEFIKNKSDATSEDFIVDIMHYPPLKEKKKLSFCEKMRRILNDFFL